jgi:predicted Zn finger-like uncharacterized protein
MTGGEKRETRIIRCPACQRYYRVTTGPPAPGTRLRCSKCGEVFSLAAAAAKAEAGAAGAQPAPVSPTTDRGRVLVSTDGADFQSLICEVLTAAGYVLRLAGSGEEAWAAIRSWRPHVALLDVALPGVPAFELCDRVRADKALHGTGLILIASVFQQTRYKRAPTSLYGADDYIEKHHIRDRLPDKVAKLLPAAAAPPGAAAAAPPPTAEKRHAGSDEREQETLIHEELYGARGRGRKGLESPQERLRRYARIIVSDIALYNQELVEKGIREGTFTELLKKEIEEGHRLYLIRVPASTGGEDYYHEAVREFIAKRTGAHAGGESRPRGKA